MLTLRVIGSLLVICGVVYMAWIAINRGRLSDPHVDRAGTGPTLEPRRQGLRFLGPKVNLPALLMIGGGVLLILLPLVLEQPQP